MRSSSWKVSAGADSSVYVQSRDIGGLVKVSLHPRDPARPGGEWRIAFTSEFMQRGGLVADQRRVVDAWDSEGCRLPGAAPVKHAVTVCLGRYSLGMHPNPLDGAPAPGRHRSLRSVTWIGDLPGPDHHWEFVVLVADPGVRHPLVPGRNSGAIGLGTIALPNGADLWVVRKLEPIGAKFREALERTASSIAQSLEAHKGPLVRRGHAIGEMGGPRTLIDVALNYRFPEGQLDEQLARQLSSRPTAGERQL